MLHPNKMHGASMLCSILLAMMIQCIMALVSMYVFDVTYWYALKACIGFAILYQLTKATIKIVSFFILRALL